MTHFTRWAAIAVVSGLLLASTTALAGSARAEDGDEAEFCSKNVNWTDKQKKEIAAEWERWYAANKSMVEHYAEAGAITAVQKDVELRHLQSYLDSVKRRNYSACFELESGEVEFKLPRGGSDDRNDD